MKNINKTNVFLKQILAVLLFIFALQCQSTESRAVSQENVNSSAGTSGTVMRALYIPNHQNRKIEYIKSILLKGKPLGINMLVMDVHTNGSTTLKVNAKVLEMLKNENVYILLHVLSASRTE